MPQNKTNLATGTGLGIVGMSAYYLPATKNRFIRSAFNVTKEITEDKIEMLNDAAKELSKNKKISGDKSIFLKELGISENLDSISLKCRELKKSITDSDIVKNLKKSFAEDFKTMKKSEALMDNITSKAFSRIRWTNFCWGTGIGFVLGHVLSSIRANNKNPQ